MMQLKASNNRGLMEKAQMKATPKDVRIDAQFKEQADEYLEIMWYEFHDE